MDAFMNCHRNQKKLWIKLVELMKENENLPLKVRENLTYLNAQSKWNFNLIVRFKRLFYQSLHPSLTSNLADFPFYDVSCVLNY